LEQDSEDDDDDDGGWQGLYSLMRDINNCGNLVLLIFTKFELCQTQERKGMAN
jgi:hypothetical protein